MSAPRLVSRWAQPAFVYPPPGCETLPKDYDPGYIQIFDSGRDDAPQHGELGPTHCGRIREPEYPYQILLLLAEFTEDWPDARRALAPDGRGWIRGPGDRWVGIVVKPRDCRPGDHVLKPDCPRGACWCSHEDGSWTDIEARGIGVRCIHKKLIDLEMPPGTWKRYRHHYKPPRSAS